MTNRRVLYWSGPLAIVWIGIFEKSEHWLQQSWQTLVLEGSATKGTWFDVVALCFMALAVAALATHLAFSIKHPAEKKPLATAWSLLPHFLLCGVLLGTSVVLGIPEVRNDLNRLNLDFLGRLLFYLAAVWSLVVVLDSLLPPSAALPKSS